MLRQVDMMCNTTIYKISYIYFVDESRIYPMVYLSPHGVDAHRVEYTHDYELRNDRYEVGHAMYHIGAHELAKIPGV